MGADVFAARASFHVAELDVALCVTVYFSNEIGKENFALESCNASLTLSAREFIVDEIQDTRKTLTSCKNLA